MPVVMSMIADGRVSYVENYRQLTTTLDALFARRPPSSWTVRMITRIWDSDGASGHAVDHQLRVVTDPTAGWGALNFLECTTPAFWQGWNSCNVHPDNQAPQLPFGQGGLVFPRNAALPLQAVYNAALEYGHTGTRPATVLWQQAHYF